MACSLIETCIFFNDKMANMPSMADMFKERYCRDAYGTCARYAVFEAVGRENVPKDLYPNEKDKVAIIVGEVRANR